MIALRSAVLACVVLSLLSGAPKKAPGPTIPPQSRTLQMDDHSIQPINTRVNFDTWIIFPQGEKIVAAGGGDPDPGDHSGNWRMSPATTQPGNIFTIKPSVRDTETNLHIQTNHGSYSFWLREVSANCPACSPDVKVFVEPIKPWTDTADPVKDDAAKAKAEMAEAQKQIQDLQAKLTTAQADLDQAKREARSIRGDAQNDADRRVAEYAKNFPAKLRCDYEFKQNHPPFNVGMICTDGVFTYIQSGSKGVESIYANKADGLALVQFSYERGKSNHEGVYVINGIITKGYLQSGKKAKLKFQVAASKG